MEPGAAGPLRFPGPPWGRAGRRGVYAVDGRPPAAGIAFSCEPRTGRRGRGFGSAAWGPGAAAGGGVRPEEVAVAIGPGRAGVVARSGDSRPILTDEQAVVLARLALRVQW